MIYYIYTENTVTEVRPLQRIGRWQRSLCTEMDIHHQPIRAYYLVEYVEQPAEIPLLNVPQSKLWG